MHQGMTRNWRLIRFSRDRNHGIYSLAWHANILTNKIIIKSTCTCLQATNSWSFAHFWLFQKNLRSICGSVHHTLLYYIFFILNGVTDSTLKVGRNKYKCSSDAVNVFNRKTLNSKLLLNIIPGGLKPPFSSWFPNEYLITFCNITQSIVWLLLL